MKIFAAVIVVMFVVADLLICYACFAVEKTPEEQAAEDAEQYEYLKQWRKNHSDRCKSRL